MKPALFQTALISEGFSEIVTVEQAADGFLATHAHPFEAKALILAGEITLQVGPLEQCYQVGQVFHLAANQLHSERYGCAGVRYLVGRK